VDLEFNHQRKEIAMRHTLILNLDEAHARQLDELRQHFHLAAEDTVRLAIRLTHARMNKPDVLVPEFKPRAAKDWWADDEDHRPE
jgi:hypothetical protein